VSGTLLTAALATAALGASADFELTRTSVRPASAFFDGVDPVVLRYRFRSAGPLDLRVRVIRLPERRTVREWDEPVAAPGETHELTWDGVNRRGRPARDGRFAFRVGLPRGPGRPAGRFTLHGHAFPVAGPHYERGPIGDFGAPRSGGRVHEGFDVMAGCGTPLVAARAGRVVRRGYDDVLYGNYVLIDGRATARNYFYSHLISPARVRRGQRVHTGQLVGKVGQTGNARTTPCHLHFEIRVNGRPVDPAPALRRWDVWS
jgi:murein DD-endopeptidase MepM/ murein hydrolase activator NlpD